MHKLSFYLFLLAFCVFFYSCEKDDSSVIDPTLHFPSVTSAYITPNSFDTTFLSAIVGASVTSELPIRTVTARILSPTNSEIASIELKDDGVAPDSVAGDGHFTGTLGTNLSCKLVGTYKVQVVAQNNSGLNSGPLNINFSVTNVNNHKPVVNSVAEPDSVLRPSGVNGDSVLIFSIEANVTDPDGICDVSDTYFHSIKPDGTPSNNGNPIHLYDDGDVNAHCDQTAGDGVWSVCVKIVNNPNAPNYVPPQLGTYTFKFNAEDWGSLVSDTLFKYIVVHQ